MRWSINISIKFISSLHRRAARAQDCISTIRNWKITRALAWIKNIAALHDFEKKVESFDGKSLSETEAADRESVLSNIRSSLLTLETIRPWELNPDTYSSGITNSVYTIMSRKFASADDRLRSAIAREKQMPAVFAAARQNLKNPPQIYTEIALQQLPGLVSFFQHDVPSAFARRKDAALKSDFAKSNAAVIAELKSYQQWLKSDLLAKSKGDFRIGAETFAKKLLYDEMVDTPLDRLLEIDMADMRENQDGVRAHREGGGREEKSSSSAERIGRGPSEAGSFVAKFSRHV